MKKLFTFLLLITAIRGYSQITFESAYTNGTVTKEYLRLVKLSSSGYKYVLNDTNVVSLYNLNHTLFKTMTLPPRPTWVANSSALSVFYISEELFNTNPSDVEYFLQYADKNYVGHSLVCDELGNILFSKDSTMVMLTAVYGNEPFISYTPSGVKMIISRSLPAGGGAEVYSLPGTIPCHDCANGVTTGIVTASDETILSGKISNYPNPSAEQTTVEYNLPQDVTAADLVFYSITGQEVKRFKVTNAFHDILISTEDLDAGTYYYQIQTTKGYTAGKKMIVIK